MFSKLLYQFRMLAGAWNTALHGTLTFGFSSVTRKRLGKAYLLWKNPFLGRTVLLSQLCDDPLTIHIGPVRSLAHNASEFELLILGTIVRQVQAKNVFEIGTYDGRSTRTFAMNVAENGKIITLNLPPGKDSNDQGTVSVDTQLNLKVASGQRFLGTPEANRIHQVFGDSASFDFTPYHGKMDMVFIDGAHTEAYAACDTSAALQMIRPEGGVIMWHDAPLYGVAPFLQRCIAEQLWPIQLIEDSTIMIGYVRNGRFVDIPLPLSRIPRA